MLDMDFELVVVCMLDLRAGPVIASVMFGDPGMTTEWWTCLDHTDASTCCAAQLSEHAAVVRRPTPDLYVRKITISKRGREHVLD